MPTLETRRFGRTGHQSSCALFGAAALAAMKPARAAGLLELLLEYGVNHIDVAASYGEAEVCLAPWLAEHRSRFFLATKTGERGAEGARESLQRSLERMRVDSVDLIQLHNLVEEADWQQAMGAGGAVEALVAARDAGLVRYLGVTGHGTQAAAMQLRSLEHFDFDSVLCPYNYTMMAQPGYATDFERLAQVCRERDVALQTIKAVARRRWTERSAGSREDEPGRRFSWYEPLRDRDALKRHVRFVLSRPQLFLNTTSDATLLPEILAAAAEPHEAPSDAELAADVRAYEMQPLFEGGISDRI